MTNTLKFTTNIYITRFVCYDIYQGNSSKILKHTMIRGSPRKCISFNNKVCTTRPPMHLFIITIISTTSKLGLLPSDEIHDHTLDTPIVLHQQLLVLLLIIKTLQPQQQQQQNEGGRKSWH